MVLVTKMPLENLIDRKFYIIMYLTYPNNYEINQSDVSESALDRALSLYRFDCSWLISTSTAASNPMKTWRNYSEDARFLTAVYGCISVLSYRENFGRCFNFCWVRSTQRACGNSTQIRRSYKTSFHLAGETITTVIELKVEPHRRNTENWVPRNILAVLHEKL